MNEFSLIEKYFAPLSRDGLINDGALIDVPEGCELAISTDVLNEGVHFPFDAYPEQIARKALRVNLSDLASMGARPLCYQLGLALPKSCNEEWIASFSKTLDEEQKEFGLFLSGGDTTSTKAGLSISITVMGLVKKGQAWTRSGAKEGDLIVLTGAVGDALLGLRVIQNELFSDDSEFLCDRYYRPQPRLDFIGMQKYVNACADISDGLLADLNHIANHSGLCAHLDMANFTFSKAAQTLIDAEAVKPEDLLCGGDDYELVMAVSPENIAHFSGVQVIGHFKEGQGVELHDGQGQKVNVKNMGWSHFS